MLKVEKGISRIALILIIALIVVMGAVAVVLILNKNVDSDNVILNNSKNDSSNDWGLVMNGESINLPCTLDKLTNAGINISSDYYNEQILNSSNQTFPSVGAVADEWTDNIFLDITTNNDISKKEKNATIKNITYQVTTDLYGKYDASKLLTKDQFHLKNDIAIGSTTEDVISTFGTDYNFYMGTTNNDLNGSMAGIIYSNNESDLYINFKDGIVNLIRIQTK